MRMSDEAVTAAVIADFESIEAGKMLDVCRALVDERSSKTQGVASILKTHSSSTPWEHATAHYKPELFKLGDDVETSVLTLANVRLRMRSNCALRPRALAPQCVALQVRRTNLAGAYLSLLRSFGRRFVNRAKFAAT